mmetsp:Transcript_886/g.2403  ORF Transcript_886/g.2403 Transcript_886/m.2403 type:complete len:184 (-) Transcript_886:132-683(-)
MAQLSIWDTAGQERFHALGPIYYRDANGALLVYDITDLESFAKVRKWVKELRKIVGNDIIIAIAGNKCDLERQRTVDNAEAEAYAESVGAVHFLTSAKANRGLEEVRGPGVRLLEMRHHQDRNAALHPCSWANNSPSPKVFLDLTGRMLERQVASDGARGNRGAAKLVILEDAEAEETKSSCC